MAANFASSKHSFFLSFLFCSLARYIFSSIDAASDCSALLLPSDVEQPLGTSSLQTLSPAVSVLSYFLIPVFTPRPPTVYVVRVVPFTGTAPWIKVRSNHKRGGKVVSR